MILTSSLEQAIEISEGAVFIAAEGSNIPHSVLINGRIEELIDPPVLPVRATRRAQLIV
jgi:hypothetical protein